MHCTKCFDNCWDLSIPGYESFPPKCFLMAYTAKEQTIGPVSLVHVSNDSLISTASLSSVGNFLNKPVLTCSNTAAMSPSPNDTSDIVLVLEGNFATFYLVYVYLHTQ